MRSAAVGLRPISCSDKYLTMLLIIGWWMVRNISWRSALASSTSKVIGVPPSFSSSLITSSLPFIPSEKALKNRRNSSSALRT